MKQIFINLPVNDVEKSMQFYMALGFTVNPLFTDKDQKCMVWSDAIYLMVQSKAFSNAYLKKEMMDPRKFQSVTHTLPVESIRQVNEMLDKGLLAGGKEPVPVLIEPFMYLRSIEDLDGFLWGIMCLDLEKFKAIKESNH